MPTWCWTDGTHHCIPASMVQLHQVLSSRRQPLKPHLAAHSQGWHYASASGLLNRPTKQQHVQQSWLVQQIKKECCLTPCGDAQHTQPQRLGPWGLHRNRRLTIRYVHKPSRYPHTHAAVHAHALLLFMCRLILHHSVAAPGAKWGSLHVCSAVGMAVAECAGMQRCVACCHPACLLCILQLQVVRPACAL